MMQATASDLNLVVRRFSMCPSGKGSHLSTQGVGGFLKGSYSFCKPAILAGQHVYLSLQVAIDLQ